MRSLCRSLIGLGTSPWPCRGRGAGTRGHGHVRPTGLAPSQTARGGVSVAVSIKRDTVRKSSFLSEKPCKRPQQWKGCHELVLKLTGLSYRALLSTTQKSPSDLLEGNLCTRYPVLLGVFTFVSGSKESLTKGTTRYTQISDSNI